MVATYFFAFRSLKLAQAVAEISYHATSGIKDPPPGLAPGGLLGAAGGGRSVRRHRAARPAARRLPAQDDAPSRRPRDLDDLLHTIAGAIIFDVFENQDARLLSLQIPEAVLRTFPAPPTARSGSGELTGFDDDRPAFGTILKPTAGITAEDVEPDRRRGRGRPAPDVHQGRRGPLSRPRLFARRRPDPPRPRIDRPGPRPPGRARPRLRAARDRGPHQILETVEAVLDAGATGVMFSETLCQRDRPDGPRGDPPSRPARRSMATTPGSASRPRDLARGHRPPRPARRDRPPPDRPGQARHAVPAPSAPSGSPPRPP